MAMAAVARLTRVSCAAVGKRQLVTRPTKEIQAAEVQQVADSVLRAGSRIVTAMAVSEPRLFFSNLHTWLLSRPELRDLTIYCANPNRAYPVFTDHMEQVRLITMFLTSAVRAHQSRSMSYLPQHLSQWGDAILRRGPVDLFWGTCSPPQANGFVSLGPSCVYETDILRNAKTVVLEVNEQLPYCHGVSVIPVDRADVLIHGTSHEPLCLPPSSYDEVEMRIAQHVASLIPDGATVQFGIGGIPNALCDALMDKKDLGVHTEMINDCIMKLCLAGVVTGRAKSRAAERVVGSFALGSPELYRWIHDHPGCLMLPGSIVNSRAELASNAKMHSVNTCVELDFTGQICSESVGHRELSGVGGASDTHLGAQLSPGGRGIIAVKSTTRSGASKIVAELKAGAKVSISRNDVDTVVTEHGIAELKGLSVSERVEALIAIADPQHRSELTQNALRLGYL